MNKQLYNLKKKDWNSLFPIALVPHNPQWPTIYEKEKQKIVNLLGNDIVLNIEHFGSTSIPNIKAKPYIDIIIEISQDRLFDNEIIDKLGKLGYTHFKVPERNGIDAYMSFGKGYNLEGKKEQIFHIHMCPKNNFMWRQVEFRDWLIKNTESAKAYEKLKIKSAEKYKYDRGAYLLSKNDFIRAIINKIDLQTASENL